jgi:hypothetical protein
MNLPTMEQVFAGLDEASFHPDELMVLASFNRRLTIDLPGVDPLTVGQRGHDLLARTALISLIQEHLPALGLESYPTGDLPQGLNECLDSTDETCRVAAEAVADVYGRRLGYLLASVLLSPQGMTSPMIGWEKAYLNYWRAHIQHVVLGGGHASGVLGRRLCRTASQVLELCGLQQPDLSVAGHPWFLPLIGEAQVLPTVPIGHLTLNENQSAELAQAMTGILADTIRRAGPEVSLAPQVICSVAAYLQDGRPVQYAGRNMGIYSWLNALAEDLPAWFSDRISAASGRLVRFVFAHDGDAAAAALAGQAHTAVIMLGSALGIGLVPPGERFRPLAPDFRVYPPGSAFYQH